MIYKIKVENNSRQILRYLEILGYKWQSGDKPTEFYPIILHNCFVVCGSDMVISYSVEDVTISFEEFKRQNPIQKKHLCSGMIVEYADGERRLVTDIKGELILISEDGFQPLSEYNEDLTINDHPDIAITKIGLSCPSSLKGMFFRATIIWERPNTITEVELTMDEIAKKFNIDVSQLKIKK